MDRTAEEIAALIAQLEAELADMAVAEGEVQGLVTTAKALVNGMQAEATFDQRWVSLGATNLQKGLMSLSRAIALGEMRALNAQEQASMDQITQFSLNVDVVVRAMEASSVRDKYWVSVAVTDLQKGLMALTRAIAKMETF